MRITGAGVSLVALEKKEKTARFLKSLLEYFKYHCTLTLYFRFHVLCVVACADLVTKAGLFAANHIPFDKDRDQSLTGQPSLEEMTAKAIQVLSRNTKGYVLIVSSCFSCSVFYLHVTT